MQDLVISGDDEVVSVDNDGVLLRWQLTDGEPVERVRLAERCVQDAAEGLELRCSSLSRSGREVLMVWDNRERFDWNTPREQHLTVVMLANLDDGSVRRRFQFEGHCNRCARSSDDRFAAVGDNSEPMWVLLDLAQGGAARIFSGSIESTYKVKGIGEMAFDAECRTLASIVNEDIALWDIASGRIVTLFRGHDPGPSDLCFSADGRLLISGGRDAVRTWNLAALRPEASFRGHPGGANGVAVLPGTRLVASAGRGRLVCRSKALTK